MPFRLQPKTKKKLITFIYFITFVTQEIEVNQDWTWKIRIPILNMWSLDHEISNFEPYFLKALFFNEKPESDYEKQIGNVLIFWQSFFSFFNWSNNWS